MCVRGGLWGVNLGGIGSASVIWELGMVLMVVGLRTLAAGDGFQAYEYVELI